MRKIIPPPPPPGPLDPPLIPINCFLFPSLEIGVIHQVPRTATIVARENVECLVIDPESCLRIFPEEINNEFETRIKYMK